MKRYFFVGIFVLYANNVFAIENNRVVVKNEENCTKCGECLKVCRYGAIIIYQ